MRIGELDGLRGLAILAVLDCHFLAWYPRLGAEFGWLGVDLFFVLSGFLITGILLELRGKQGYFRTFYARRALRILPPYFLGLAVYMAVSVALGMPGSWKLWLSYIFYYSSLFSPNPAHRAAVPLVVGLGLAVLWSLSVEELYYTAWAPLIRFANKRAMISILAVMIVSAPLLRWYLHTTAHWELFTLYCRMDGLAYGSAIALLARDRRLLPAPWKKWDGFFDGMTAALLCLAAVMGAIFGGRPANPWVASLGLTLADLCFAALTFALVRKAGGNQWWVRVFRLRWLRSVGMVSYSLYLFHYPLYHIAGHLIAMLSWSRRVSAVSQVLLAAMLSFGVAYALWYAMESRILCWKDRKVPSPAHVTQPLAETAPVAF